MSKPLPSPHRVQQTKKLRSACDTCHQCKVKCSGGSTCSRCASKGFACHYGFRNRAGKPKGSKNKKTLERQRQMSEAWMSQLSSPSSIADDATTATFDSEQPGFSPCSTIIDNTDWFQGSAFYSGSSLTAYTRDQFAFNDAIYRGPTSGTSNEYSEPWTMDPNPHYNLSNDKTMAECNKFITRSRVGSVDGVSGDESDSLLALGAEMDLPTASHMTWMPTSCNCMQKQAANITSLGQIRSDNAQGLERFDTVMRCVTVAIDCCLDFVNCSFCEKSFSSIVLTLSVFNLVFLVLKQSIDYKTPSGTEIPQSNIPCFIGNYKISTEEQEVIQRTILEMSVRKGNQALKAVRGLVTISTDQRRSSFEDFLGTDSAVKRRSLCRLSACDKDYVVSYIARMQMSTIGLMSCSLATPPLATP